MEDELSQKIDRLLNSPEGMQQIQNVMAALGVGLDGGDGDAPVAAPSAAPTAAPEPPASPEPSGSDGGLSSLLHLAPLLGSLGKDDQNTTLLKALRPYLHDGREKRLDESLKFMQLLKLLPLLQEKGGLFR